MKNLEQRIEELLEPVINELGYEIYDVEYIKHTKEYYLRIYIDKEEGISIEDCEKVSNAINDLLDEADYIKEQYYLEVSSPGIEKILKKDEHFRRNLGKLVEISLYTKFENKKQFIGTLQEFNENEVVILTEDEELRFDRKNITQVKQIHIW